MADPRRSVTDRKIKITLDREGLADTDYVDVAVYERNQLGDNNHLGVIELVTEVELVINSNQQIALIPARTSDGRIHPALVKPEKADEKADEKPKK